jgi:AbrB family looped-hinge helix DNA binding protein
MPTASLTSKGQITIPADVRRALNVEAGDCIEFVAATQSVRALKGMFGKARRRMSIGEMNTVIAKKGAGSR